MDSETPVESDTSKTKQGSPSFAVASCKKVVESATVLFDSTTCRVMQPPNLPAMQVKSLFCYVVVSAENIPARDAGSRHALR